MHVPRAAELGLLSQLAAIVALRRQYFDINLRKTLILGAPSAVVEVADYGAGLIIVTEALRLMRDQATTRYHDLNATRQRFESYKLGIGQLGCGSIH